MTKLPVNRAERRALRAQGKWVPLVPAKPKPLTDAEIWDRVDNAVKIAPRLSREQALAYVIEAATDEMWMNDLYVVTVRRSRWDNLPLVHLSIRRQDRGIAKDWRDFQRIKNQLVGPECEGIELYPAESRLVDTATSWHIWCVSDPSFRFPFGFQERLVVGESGGGSVQRPFPDQEESTP